MYAGSLYLAKKVLVRDGQLHIPHHAGGLPGLLHRGAAGALPEQRPPWAGAAAREARWTGAASDRGAAAGRRTGCGRLGRRCGGLRPGKRARAAFPARGRGPLFLLRGRGYPLAHRDLSPVEARAAGRPLGGLLGSLAALGRGALGGRGRPAAGLLLAGGQHSGALHVLPHCPGRGGPPLGGRVGWCWGPATCWPRGRFSYSPEGAGRQGTAGPGFLAAGRRAPGVFRPFSSRGTFF